MVERCQLRLKFHLNYYFRQAMSNEANPGLLPSQEQMFEMIKELQKKAKEDEEEKARKDEKIAALEGQFEVHVLRIHMLMFSSL